MNWNDITIAIGGTGAVKALGNGKVGGYLVQFSSANDPDLSGEYFTANTDFDVEDGAATAVYYHHGLDKTIKARKLGTGTIKKDAIGMWVEAQLSLRDEYEKHIYKLAEQGKLGWSSGTAVHLAEYKPAGKATEIIRWPLGLDASLTPTPAEPRTRVLPLKSYDPPQATLTGPEGQRSEASADATTSTGIKTMDENDIKRMVAEATAAAIKADREATAAAAQAEADEKARTDAAVKAALDAAAKEWAAGNRLADTGGVEVGTPLKFSEVTKFDGLDAGDVATVIGVLDAHQRHGGRRPSEAAYKALALKLDESKTQTGESFRHALKSWGIKANEVQYSTLASFGDEWVSVAYSNAIWESIRQNTFVLDLIQQREVPQGAESVILPLEGADPTWYKVPQTTAINATTGRPDATVPSSRMGTSNATLTVSKMGARVLFSGELEEDSIIPFAAQLRRQLSTSGAEMLEHAIIDGDTDATATTNINDIGGTPAATDLFLLMDGFRKLPLITNTANSRAGGTLTSGDFLATVKLLGASGLNSVDIAKVVLISDINTHWTSLELADVKSRDVFAAATIETGKLTGIYGYRHYVSPWMHYMSATRRANTAGKVDQDTTANNTTGSILAIRPDQWIFGWKRRMTMETQRFPDADTTQIVALARVGLKYRDTEAAAISYGLTVS
jgi:HK97 family phage major capsid protein